jgi:hypothetical protein
MCSLTIRSTQIGKGIQERPVFSRVRERTRTGSFEPMGPGIFGRNKARRDGTGTRTGMRVVKELLESLSE